MPKNSFLKVLKLLFSKNFKFSFFSVNFMGFILICHNFLFQCFCSKFQQVKLLVCCRFMHRRVGYAAQNCLEKPQKSFGPKRPKNLNFSSLFYKTVNPKREVLFGVFSKALKAAVNLYMSRVGSRSLVAQIYFYASSIFVYPPSLKGLK